MICVVCVRVSLLGIFRCFEKKEGGFECRTCQSTITTALRLSGNDTSTSISLRPVLCVPFFEFVLSL